MLDQVVLDEIIVDHYLSTSGELGVVLSRLRDLLTEGEAETELKPTDYAITTAARLILETSDYLHVPFLRATVSTDEDGAVYIYWRKPSRKVHLNIPALPSEAPHVYYREGEQYGVEKDTSAERLAHWLEWYSET
jgi:hypothetical protein